MAIYLITMEAKKGIFCKTGITSDMDSRMRQYRCHNPLAKLDSYIETRKGSKLGAQLENDFHAEMQARGMERNVNGTEWFYTESEEIMEGIARNGIGFFDSCKGRKIYR